MRELSHAAARALLAFQHAGDGASRAADAPAYQQLIAAASVDAPCGGLSPPRAGCGRNRDWQVPQLDQLERARHIRVPLEDAATSKGQGDAGDLHRVRTAAARRVTARHG